MACIFMDTTCVFKGNCLLEISDPLNMLFALSFLASDAERVEPSVGVANTVLVRNTRFASDKSALKI
jgi:hypothetical protein